MTELWNAISSNPILSGMAVLQGYIYWELRAHSKRLSLILLELRGERPISDNY